MMKAFILYVLMLFTWTTMASETGTLPTMEQLLSEAHQANWEKSVQHSLLIEASLDEVWNYITLYVAPDVANWRYPNPGNNPRYDRHLGGYRNVFRQPWARGYFCSWDDALISELTEDIAVAIFERVNVASNPRVAIACLKATYKIRLKDKNNKIYRDALKRVVRIMSVRSLDQLPESSLQDLIDGLFDQSYKHFAKAK
jgi:hypothetical protein